MYVSQKHPLQTISIESLPNNVINIRLWKQVPKAHSFVVKKQSSSLTRAQMRATFMIQRWIYKASNGIPWYFSRDSKKEKIFSFQTLKSCYNPSSHSRSKAILSASLPVVPAPCSSSNSSDSSIQSQSIRYASQIDRYTHFAPRLIHTRFPSQSAAIVGARQEIYT